MNEVEHEVGEEGDEMENKEGASVTSPTRKTTKHWRRRQRSEDEVEDEVEQEDEGSRRTEGAGG